MRRFGVGLNRSGREGTVLSGPEDLHGYSTIELTCTLSY